MSYLRLILLFLVYTCHSRAQYLDSLGEVIKGKSSIDLRFESRWSFVNNEPFTIKGIRIGASFEKKLRIGGGINWLKTEIKTTTEVQDENGTFQPVDLYFKLGYILGYVDVVFYKTKHWQLSVPIQVGTGFTWWQDQSQYKLSDMQSRHFLFFYEPGITVQYKFTKWFGVGIDVAYRFTLKNSSVSEKLNSPTYSFKIDFWLDQLYFLILPESKWSKRYGPASW